MMDWSQLPWDLEAKVDDDTIDLFFEIERAKSQTFFPFFIQSLIYKYDLPKNYVWGDTENEENEPLEDLREFITFLVEAGYGSYASGDLHDATSVKETRMHSKVLFFCEKQIVCKSRK